MMHAVGLDYLHAGRTIPTGHERGRTGILGALMRKLFLGSMAVAAMIAGPAMAADMPVKAKAPPPPVVYDWSGAYVGFNIGGAWYDVERTYTNLGGFSIKSSGEDVIYGFHAGAQGQWGNWVLGIEAAYSA